MRNPGSLPARIEVVLGGRLDGIGHGWTVAAGKTLTLSLTLSSASRPSGAVTVSAYQRNGSGDDYPDPHPGNNEISVAVRAG